MLLGDPLSSLEAELGVAPLSGKSGDSASADEGSTAGTGEVIDPSPLPDTPSASDPVAPAASAPVSNEPEDLMKALGLATSDLYTSEEDWAVTSANLAELVGKRVFTSDRCVCKHCDVSGSTA